MEELKANRGTIGRVVFPQRWNQLEWESSIAFSNIAQSGACYRTPPRMFAVWNVPEKCPIVCRAGKTGCPNAVGVRYGISKDPQMVRGQEPDLESESGSESPSPIPLN
jgi:hypothetical protein